MKHPIDDQWSIEVTDGATFIQYRDIDLVSLWLPYDDSERFAYLSISDHEQLAEAEDPLFNTQWAMPNEMNIDLGGRVRAIDYALLRRQAKQANTIDDWRYEVANGDTVLGFEEWQNHKIDEAKSDSFEK